MNNLIKFKLICLRNQDSMRIILCWLLIPGFKKTYRNYGLDIKRFENNLKESKRSCMWMCIGVWWKENVSYDKFSALVEINSFTRVKSRKYMRLKSVTRCN